jgi:hypothetical protein
VGHMDKARLSSCPRENETCTTVLPPASHAGCLNALGTVRHTASSCAIHLRWQHNRRHQGGGALGRAGREGAGESVCGSVPVADGCRRAQRPKAWPTRCICAAPLRERHKPATYPAPTWSAHHGGRGRALAPWRQLQENHHGAHDGGHMVDKAYCSCPAGHSKKRTEKPAPLSSSPLLPTLTLGVDLQILSIIFPGSTGAGPPTASWGRARSLGRFEYATPAGGRGGPYPRGRISGWGGGAPGPRDPPRVQGMWVWGGGPRGGGPPGASLGVLGGVARVFGGPLLGSFVLGFWGVGLYRALDKISRRALRARRLFLSGGRLYSLVDIVWVLR